jgi:hypothetical protein
MSILSLLIFVPLNLESAARSGRRGGTQDYQDIMGPPHGVRYRIIQDAKIPLTALRDQELVAFLFDLSMRGGGYNGAIAYIKTVCANPYYPAHKVAVKYFTPFACPIAEASVGAITPQEKTRADLKQKFGNDCPIRAEEWESYEPLAEKYNAIFAQHNINLLLTPETIAHVRHFQVTDADKLIGFHFYCDYCISHNISSHNIGKGKDGQIAVAFSYWKEPLVPPQLHKETTFFNFKTTTEEVLEKITKALIVNNPRFVKRTARKIDIQAEDGEYITILLRNDGITIATFFPSMDNFSM